MALRRHGAAAALLLLGCATSARDVVVFRHSSAEVDPKAPQPTGNPPTCIRNPTVARLISSVASSANSSSSATLLAVAECRYWAGDGCRPKNAALPAGGVSGPWPEPTRGCSRLSTDSGASWAPLVHNVTGMGAIDMQAVFLPPLNKVMLAFNRHNPRHVDDDHVLWYRLGYMSTSLAMIWEAPVSVQQRLVRPAGSARDAWWAACPGPGRATILQNTKAPHAGRIMLAVYQEGIKGNPDWDPSDCRNPNFTSSEGDWAASYYSDDNGSSWRVSRTKDPLGPWGYHVFAGMSEPTVTQLPNGTVRMDFRQGTRRKECACRMFAISTDGGSSFDRLQFDRQLISPECQGSMLEAGGSLYFSNPRSTTTRTNMCVLRSDTNGANWSAHVAVSAAGVATSSSCLVDLSTPGETKVGTAGEATVGLMYERGTDDCVGASCEIVFTTLPPSRFTPLSVRDRAERHRVLKNDDSAAKIMVNADGDHAGYAENIFPEEPNHDAQGRAIPIQQNTCKGKTYPNVQYEQGQLFQVTAAGHVVAVRFFAAALERGAHEARIWRMTDKKKLAEVTIPASVFNGTARWIQYALGPVRLAVGVSYMVTVTTGTDRWHAWAGCPACWLPAGTNGHHITWPTSSARFGTAVGSIPTHTPQYGESYLKDIVFCTGKDLQNPCGPPAPPPVPAEIYIAGPLFVERPPNSTGKRRTMYRAQGVDHNGQDLQPALLRNLSWSIAGGTLAGVSLTKVTQTSPQSPCLAFLEVDGILAADTILNLTAMVTNGTNSVAMFSTKVTVALLKATAVTVTGPAAVNLNVTAAEMHTYKAVVVDQLGQPIVPPNGTSLNWSLASAEQIDPSIVPKMTKPPPRGVSMDPATGILTVSRNTDRGDFTVTCHLIGSHGREAVNHAGVFVAGDSFDAVAFLSTNDTSLTVSTGGVLPGLRIRSIKHRTAGWEWIDDDGDALPLPSPRGAPPVTWRFTHIFQNETVASFYFEAGPLQLESTWMARDGGGPVDNSVIVRNSGSEPVVFDSSLQSCAVKMMTPSSSILSMYEKRGAGTPLPPMEIVWRPSLSFSLPTGGPGHTEKEGQYLPMAFITASGSRYTGTRHGIFIGSEWELGRVDVNTRQVDITTLSINPIGRADSAKNLEEDYVTIAASSTDPNIHASFAIPSVYYGAFQGDVDDGSNSFKQWFWTHKITRSLYDNTNEPWTEICWEPITGALFPGPARTNVSGAGELPQALYNLTAATGVEALKIDFGWYDARNWTWRAKDWPSGFDFKTKAHIAGMNASLYMGGSFHDVNLSTIAGRDAELAAVMERYKSGYMDMWRTDTYTAPENPLPDSFAGVTNFLYIMDHLIAANPGFRYENCANGGHFKGLALARRFTFVTTNDNAPSGINYRQTHWLNSHVLNPLQLKCDTQVGGHNLNYMLRTCLLGSWLLAMPNALDILHNKNYSEHIRLYKSKQRPIMRGGQQFHILPFPDGDGYDGMQYHNDALGQGSVVVFKPAATTPPSINIPLRGLERHRSYRLSYQEREYLGTIESGAVLMDRGLQLKEMDGAEASEVVWIDTVA